MNHPMSTGPAPVARTCAEREPSEHEPSTVHESTGDGVPTNCSQLKKAKNKSTASSPVHLATLNPTMMVIVQFNYVCRLPLRGSIVSSSGSRPETPPARIMRIIVPTRRASTAYREIPDTPSQSQGGGPRAFGRPITCVQLHLGRGRWSDNSGCGETAGVASKVWISLAGRDGNGIGCLRGAHC